MDSLYKTDNHLFFIAPSDFNGGIHLISFVLQDGKWQRDLEWKILGNWYEKILDLTPKSRLSMVVITGTAFNIKE